LKIDITPDEYKRLLYFRKHTKSDISKGTVPAGEQIIAAKKLTLSTEIETVVATKAYESNTAFAKELLAKWSPEELVSSLITHAYRHEFSEERYAPLAEVNIDTSGTSRLFIALGKKHGYSLKTLIDYIGKTAEIDVKNIANVTVLEDFSFVNVSFEDAEAVLHAFGKLKKRWEKPLVTKAKERSGW